jgi:hypothetical protein
MEILDGKATMLLQMLSTLQGACHSTDGDEMLQGLEMETTTGAAMHGTMEGEGTLVEEEATPAADPMTNATSMDAWPCYKPTT